MSGSITISGRRIGPDQPCFLIAEVAQAHDGSLGAAHAYIDAAADAGRAALLVAALGTAPQHLLAATRDYLHQDYRRPAMPDSLALVDALRLDGVPAVVGPLVAPARDHRADAPPRQQAADQRVTVALVAHELAGAEPRPAAPRAPHVPAREEGFEVPRLVALAAG